MRTMRQALLSHTLIEAEYPDGIHPEGCWYCSGKHKTFDCEEFDMVHEEDVSSEYKRLLDS